MEEEITPVTPVTLASVLSLALVKSYIEVDFDDSDTYINMLISVTDKWLKGAVSEEYDPADERVQMLALMVISDLYDNRGSKEEISAKLKNATNKAYNDLILQLKVEAL